MTEENSSVSEEIHSNEEICIVPAIEDVEELLDKECETNKKIADWKLKLGIIEKIHFACKMNFTMNASVAENFENYTLLNLNITNWEKEFKLKYETQSVNLPQKEYQDACKNNELRHKIYKMYIEDEIIPTKSNLFESLKESEDGKNLKEAGFQWKPIPNQNRYLLVENAEKVAKRIEYLKKITRYRQEGYVFIYVCEFMSHTNDVVLNAAISTYNKLWRRCLWQKRGTESKFCDKFSDFLQFRPEKTVVVFEDKFINSEKLNTVPDMYASKKEMLKWLLRNNIPHDMDFHKSELYALIKKYEHLAPKETYKYHSELLAHGFKTLVTPCGYHTLNIYFYMKCPFLSKPITYYNLTQDVLYSVITKLNKVNIQDMESNLIKEETKMLEEDLVMEDITDGILTMGKFNENLDWSKFEMTN